MIVRYEGQSTPLSLINGKEYPVESIECGWYRIVDESEEDYLYPARCFSVVDPHPQSPTVEPTKQP